MARIVAAANDRQLLLRWSDMVGAAGHGCLVVPPGSLDGGVHPAADICLYDLGPRAGADPRHLLKVMQANPQTRFVALSARPEAAEGLRLLREGVRGYCNRLVGADALAALLSTVTSGEIWAGREVTDYLLDVAPVALARGDPDALLSELTAREAEIAAQVAAGLSNKVIAIENAISERTVKAHLNSIFRKTGIRNRVQLALAVSQAEHARRRRSNG